MTVELCYRQMQKVHRASSGSGSKGELMSRRKITAGACRPVRMRVEYEENPLGIDERCPRFFWAMADSRRGARQTAYQIQVTSDSGAVWDSGMVRSDESIQIPYGGKPLKPRTRYRWRVRLWDMDRSETPWSDYTWFETGLMDTARWGARWIEAARPDRGSLIPAAYLRRTFALDKPIAEARLYATALGVYECHVNGTRVGDRYLAPGWTVYEKRVQYQTYDITGLVREGDNAVGAILGDGWYAGTIGGAWTSHAERRYGVRTAFRAELHVTYTDGSSVSIYSDPSWRFTTGPIIMSDFYMGEDYDARKELGNWTAPDYNDKQWGTTKARQEHMMVTAQAGPPVRATKEIRPIGITQPQPGVWIIDMGQNMVGWERLRVRGSRGTKVTVRHAEMLNPDGTLYTENLRQAKATSTYILKGGDEEVFEPHFTFFGFQYIELTGYPGEPTLDSVTGIVLHSDMEQTGAFSCSKKLVNQLQHNIEWGQRGNYLDIPTDCPQRDERLGWTGDAQVFCRTAAFNFDIARFYNKWLFDLNDSQSADGKYPNVAPEMPECEPAGASAWADAGVICPWVIYQCYGDKRILERHYPNMKKWITLQKKNSKGLLSSRAMFGDWLNIDDPTPNEVISTAFFAFSTRLMSRIAEVLGKTRDAQQYQRLFERIRDKFNDEFITPSGRVFNGSQTSLILALHFDLLPRNRRAAAMESLVKNIQSRKGHLSCGFVGSPYINFVLSDNGRTDTAFELLNQTSWPSWLYAVTQGATTIWERWDGWTHDKGFQSPAMNSFNHYAYGAIGEWLYRRVAGIDTDESHPAYKHIVIEPQPGGGLRRARGGYESLYGEVVSSWGLGGGDGNGGRRKESGRQRQRGRRNGNAFVLELSIPPNTTATVRLPVDDAASVRESGKALEAVEGLQSVKVVGGRVQCTVGAGRYRFVVE
ncbi:MAG: Bacterial alpha-L-rhamnosidase [Chitinivibrionales bacterium]|nr:Bacterial alpha-L-rhamnosidase [Chitinivibrionales bacterium]